MKEAVQRRRSAERIHVRLDDALFHAGREIVSKAAKLGGAAEPRNEAPR